MAETAVVVLAAGAGSRMGSPKQLLAYGSSTLVRHAVEQALQSKASKVVVVVGAESDAVAAALAGLDVEIAPNPLWQGGMGTSIHAGVEAAQPCGNVILTLADQPQLDAAVYDRLMDLREQTGQDIVASSYAGTVGVPVLFSGRHFDDLRALGASEGCKGLILRHLAEAKLVDCPEAEADIDTPEDYAQLTAKR